MSYLHCAWKYLMRFCSKSTPFLILISLTLRRYCKDIYQIRSPFKPHFPGWIKEKIETKSRQNEPDLTHLQLEESPLLLHLLCDFRPADLRPDHPVLSCMLLLLLLYLGAANGGGHFVFTTHPRPQQKINKKK